MSKISLIHGEGGLATGELIKNYFYKYFNNEILLRDHDAAALCVNKKIAYTTDSFVVKPIFFSGGDIGSLAVHGTVNDLVASGARPKYLSSAFIIEEGFELDKLERIVKSMAEAARSANVQIVTGDTKVVARGEADGIFINTSGIGEIEDDYQMKDVETNDAIIITGTIAEHGTVILNERYNLNIVGDLVSDSQALNGLIDIIKPFTPFIKIMKDPTRGGIGSILNEIATQYQFNIELDEKMIPIRDQVLAVNQILGIDPLYVASEGRMVIAIKEDQASRLLINLRENGYKQASIIGRFMINNKNPTVYLKTKIGGSRVVSPLDHHILPRIC